MDALFAKLKNFWYYYKVPAVIGLFVLGVVIWLNVQDNASPEPDYHIALISTAPRSEEALDALIQGFADAGEDRNGDGEISVQLHTYAVDLADRSDNAGYNNYELIAALDADLIGKVSGLFLMEDPEALQSASDGLLAEPWLPYTDGLYLCIRADAPDAYQALFDSVQSFLTHPLLKRSGFFNSVPR